MLSQAFAGEETEGFRLRVHRSVRIALNQAKAVSLTLVPQRGYAISRDGPITVAVKPADEGVEIRRRRYQRRDAVDPAADAPRFEFRLRGTSPGDHEVAIETSFWLCGKRTCWPVQRRLVIRATVVAAPAESQPGADAGPSTDAGR